MRLFIIIFLLWNFCVFLLYGFDKLCAKKSYRRISERALLACAFCMGSFGAALGMTLFRHKTAKPKFRICVPLACVFNAVILGILASVLL